MLASAHSTRPHAVIPSVGISVHGEMNPIWIKNSVNVITIPCLIHVHTVCKTSRQQNTLLWKAVFYAHTVKADIHTLNYACMRVCACVETGYVYVR